MDLPYERIKDWKSVAAAARTGKAFYCSHHQKNNPHFHCINSPEVTLFNSSMYVKTCMKQEKTLNVSTTSHQQLLPLCNIIGA